MPFQGPAGHWSRYVAPSDSFPLTVLTAPEPPQDDDDAAAVLAVLAASPPMARPAASASPAIFLDRTINATLPLPADLLDGK